MMAAKMTQCRSYGSGRVYVRTDSNGRETSHLGETALDAIKVRTPLSGQGSIQGSNLLAKDERINRLNVANLQGLLMGAAGFEPATSRV